MAKHNTVDVEDLQFSDYLLIALFVGVCIYLYWVVESFFSFCTYLYTTFGIVPRVIVGLIFTSFSLPKIGENRNSRFIVSMGKVSNTMLAGACACFIIQLFFLWMQSHGHFVDSERALRSLTQVNSVFIKILIALTIIYLLLLVSDIVGRRYFYAKAVFFAFLNERLGKITLAIKTICIIFVIPVLVVSVHKEYTLRNILAQQVQADIHDAQGLMGRAVVYAVMIGELEHLNKHEKQGLSRLFYQDKVLVELFVNGYNKWHPHPDIVQAFRLDKVKPLVWSPPSPGKIIPRSIIKENFGAFSIGDQRPSLRTDFEFVPVHNVQTNDLGVVRFDHHFRVQYEHQPTLEYESNRKVPAQYVELMSTYTTNIITTWKLPTEKLLSYSVTAKADRQATSELLSVLRNELIDKIAATVAVSIGIDVDDNGQQMKRFINLVVEQAAKSYLEFIVITPSITRKYEEMLALGRSFIAQHNGASVMLPLRGVINSLTKERVAQEARQITTTVKGLWAAGIQETESPKDTMRKVSMIRKTPPKPKPRPRGR